MIWPPAGAKITITAPADGQGPDRPHGQRVGALCGSDKNAANWPTPATRPIRSPTAPRSRSKTRDIDASKAVEIRKAIEELRSAAASDDLDKIKRAIEKMNSYLHELSAKLYEQARAQQGSAGDAAAGGSSGGAADAENVVDADYDVKDDGK